ARQPPAKKNVEEEEKTPKKPVKVAGEETAPAAKATAKPEDRLQKLLKERVEVAETEVKDLTENVQAGRGSPETLFEPSVRLLVAQRELTDNKADQLAAYEAHLKRMKEIEKISKALFDAGRISRIQFSPVRYHRLEAEIWLERAKAKR